MPISDLLSISGIRAMFEKKGCQVVIWVIGALVAFSMLFVGQCSRSNMMNQGEGQKAITVATVGTKVITAKDFDDKVNEVALQLRGSDSSDPDTQFYKYSQALDSLITGAIIEQMGTKAGIKVTDEAIIDAQIDELKMSLVLQGQLKPDATRKDLETYVLSKGGDLNKMTENIRTQLKEGTGRSQAAMGMTVRELLKQREGSVQVSDEELKSDYETLLLKQLRFIKAAAGGAIPEEQAQKALADIRGGMEFDKAVAKYAPGAPTTPMKLARTLVSSSETYKPLRELKVGETSEILDDNGAKVIYQLTKVEQNLPKDFDKTKDTLKTNLRRSKAQKSLEEEVKKAKETTVKWGSPVFKTLSEASDALRTFDKVKVMDAYKSAEALETADSRLKTLIRYEMLKVYARLAPKEAEELLAQRIEVGNAVLENTENGLLRLEIADLCLKNKDKEGALTQYLQAATNNAEFEQANQKIKVDIETAINKAVKDKVFTEEEVKPIRAEIKRWVDAFKLDEQEKAKQKAEDAAAKRKAEEDAKKEEEALKAQENAQKAKDAGKAPVAPKAGGQ